MIKTSITLIVLGFLACLGGGILPGIFCIIIGLIIASASATTEETGETASPIPPVKIVHTSKNFEGIWVFRENGKIKLKTNRK